MAFTVTTMNKSVFGDMRVHNLIITADGTSDEMDSGLDYIYVAHMSAKSAASAPNKIQANVLTAATASNGYYSITGVASGDDFYVTLFGR